MIIVLPWPDKRLSPNAKRRTHWRVYQPVTKKAREDAATATLEAAKGRIGIVRWELGEKGPIPITVRFYPPDFRHRDDDGMIGSFKAARDGIADALQVSDRRFRPHYIFEEPEKPGRVEIVIHSISREETGAWPLQPSAECLQNKSGPSACGNTEPGPDRNTCCGGASGS